MTPVPVAAAPPLAVVVPVVVIVLDPLVTVPVVVKVPALVTPVPVPVGAGPTAPVPPVMVVVSWLALLGRVAATTTPLAALASEAEYVAFWKPQRRTISLILFRPLLVSMRSYNS